MKKTKCKYGLIVLLFLPLLSHSQNFNYTLNKDSSSYAALSSPIILTAAENWNSKNFSIHLPFQFNFCGSTTDSLTIHGNGFITFDHSKLFSVVAFNNCRSNKDTNQSYVSSINYLTTGEEGNRITKIEFKNLSQNKLSNTDYLNYQLWLYENENKIEFHIGSNYYGSHPESQIPLLLGLINRNMDTENKAYLINGDPYNPSAQLISGDNEFVYLNNSPTEGTILKLTPTF